METPVIQEIVEQLRSLPGDLQWRVLEFTRALAVSGPSGVSGKRMLRFAGAVPPDDVRRMAEAIERGCERVDADEW